MIRTKIAAIIMATVLVVGALYIGSSGLAPVGAAALPEEPRATCGERGTGTVQHWDKIVFKSKKGVFIAGHEGPEEIFDKKTIMDIKALDDPNRIEFPMQKAADMLNRAEWITDEGERFTPNDLKLVDIEYAIVCIPTDEERLLPQ